MSDDSPSSWMSVFCSIRKHGFKVRWVVYSTIQRRVIGQRWYGERPGGFHDDAHFSCTVGRCRRLPRPMDADSSHGAHIQGAEFASLSSFVSVVARVESSKH
jgi:hypothetical protein